MTLRGRLLLALAYILLLAIVALEVPLAISLRDRVDAEVRSQARSQAEVVAATVAGNLDAPARLDRTVKTAAETVRGRVVVTDLAGRAAGRLRGHGPARHRLRRPARDRAGAAARQAGPGPPPQRHARPGRSSPPPCRWSSGARASARCG